MYSSKLALFKPVLPDLIGILVSSFNMLKFWSKLLFTGKQFTVISDCNTMSVLKYCSTKRHI